MLLLVLMLLVLMLLVPVLTRPHRCGRGTNRSCAEQHDADRCGTASTGGSDQCKSAFAAAPKPEQTAAEGAVVAEWAQAYHRNITKLQRDLELHKEDLYGGDPALLLFVCMIPALVMVVQLFIELVAPLRLNVLLEMENQKSGPDDESPTLSTFMRVTTKEWGWKSTTRLLWLLAASGFLLRQMYVWFVVLILSALEISNRMSGAVIQLKKFQERLTLHELSLELYAHRFEGKRTVLLQVPICVHVPLSFSLCLICFKPGWGLMLRVPLSCLDYTRAFSCEWHADEQFKAASLRVAFPALNRVRVVSSPKSLVLNGAELYSI